MPQQKDNQVQTNPSPSLLQRLFGSQPMAPEIQKGIDIAKKENPNVGDVKQFGPISNILMSNALGYTSPGQSIYVNPSQMAGSNPQDIADTVLHEQKHVDQMKARGNSSIHELLSEMFGYKEPYYQRPDEMAAYQLEKDRRQRMGRSPTAVPSFTNGEMYVPMDTYLPSPKVKR